MTRIQRNRHPRAIAALAGLLVVAFSNGTISQAQANNATRASDEAVPTPLAGAFEDATAHAPTDESIQALVDAVADQIEALPGASLAIGGLAVDVRTKSVNVWWSGETTAALKELIGTRPFGVQVNVKPAQFSRARLTDVSKSIVQDSIAGQGPAVYSAAPQLDGSGVRVTISRGQAASDEEAVSSAHDKLVARQGPEVPLTVEIGSAATGTVRQNGADPWEGGMLMQSAKGYCSIAFGINTPNGQRILSARHCGLDTDDWFDMDYDPFVTATAVSNTNYDTLILDPIGQAAGRIYGGPYDATTSDSRFLLAVKGGEANHVGDYICTGGANSGEHCVPSIKILAVNEVYQVDGFGVVMHRGYNDNNYPINVGGDSGGPVYRRSTNQDIYARGVIYGSLNNTSISCPPTAVYPGTNSTTGLPACYRSVLFVPISSLLSNANGSLLTYP